MPSKGGRGMNLEQAIQTLSHHQKWRLRTNEYMVQGETLTQAIDIILEHFKEKEE